METERLILRRYRSEDLQDLYEYLSDAVELKSTGKLIGNVHPGKRDFQSLELGYVFNKDYWGQGYAKESCAVLIEKAFA